VPGFARPVAVHLGGVEHRLDPAANPIRRLGLRRPNRSENLHYQAGVDSGNRQIAQRREHVAVERVAPLLPVCRIAPAGFLVAQEFFGNLAEGSSLGHGKALRLLLSSLRRERVYPVQSLFTVLRSLPARLCERNVGVGS